MVALLVFIMATLAEKNTVWRKRSIWRLNVFKNRARYIIPYIILIVVAIILFLDSYVNQLTLLASIASAEFKRTFTLKRGIEGQQQPMI